MFPLPLKFFGAMFICGTDIDSKAFKKLRLVLVLEMACFSVLSPTRNCNEQGRSGSGI